MYGTARKLKVCMISSSFPRYEGDCARAGKAVYMLAKELSKHVDIEVVAPHDRGAETFEAMDGMNVHRFRYGPERFEKVAFGSGGIPDNLRKSWIARLQFPIFFVCFLAKSLPVCRRCDVVNVHHFSFLVPFLRFFARKPIVLTVRGEEVRMPPRFLSKWIFGHADVIVSPHPELSDAVRELGYGHKLVEIPNLIESEPSDKRDPAGFEKEFGLKDRKVVTFVGRLVDFKDPLTFIEALPHVLHGTEDVKFLLVGDGPLRDEVAKRAVDLGVDGSLVATGERNDVVDNVLANTDVFVAISPVENIWSLALVEAVAAGIPVVMTDSGYSRKIFSHGENAYIVPPKSPRELAGGITALLGSPELREKLARNAIRLMEQKGFSQTETVARTLQIYKDLGAYSPQKL